MRLVNRSKVLKHLNSSAFEKNFDPIFGGADVDTMADNLLRIVANPGEGG